MLPCNALFFYETQINAIDMHMRDFLKVKMILLLIGSADLLYYSRTDEADIGPTGKIMSCLEAGAHTCTYIHIV